MEFGFWAIDFYVERTKEIADKVAENMQKIYNEIVLKTLFTFKINDQGIRIV